MGISKAMMEKVMVAKSRNVDPARTVFCCTRYGNVMASRGSVIPLFADQVHRGHPITITDPTMTRFMMTLEDAVELVSFAFRNGSAGDIFIQKAPAATLQTVAEALLQVLGKSKHRIEIIGTRHGEKRFETLLSREEMAAAEDLGRYFRIPPDLRDLNYGKFVEQGEPRISQFEDYNSNNTERLDVGQMKSALLKLGFVQKLLAGETPNGED
jgi:UDP-glucose 4-epimerase